MHTDVIRFRKARYLWWSLGLAAVCMALFASHAGHPASGSTLQGYALGTVAGLLVLWLSWLGVRKRSYRSGSGSLQAWTSAHIYLGVTLFLIASLHSSMEFGWNVHSLTYVLMCLVIFSGIFGLQFYLGNPRRASKNRSGMNRDELFEELQELNHKAGQFVFALPGDMQALVRSSLQRSSLGGGVIDQLFGLDRSTALDLSGNMLRNADQRMIIERVAELVPTSRKTPEVVAAQELLTLLCRRQVLLRRIRKDIQYQGWLRVWLYVHVPMTFALLIALFIHVLTVFLYW